MTFFVRFLLLGMILLVHACTGQKPAPLKNSTTPRNYVKAECSNILFQGQVLSKTNILNIFECSGWGKQYPDLVSAIEKADETAVNQTFKIINDQFFSTKEQRKAFYEIVATAEERGEMKSISTLLVRGLSDHKILGQMSKALNSQKFSLTERSDFMKVLSPSNEENLKLVRALKNLAKAFENHKAKIHSLLTAEDKKLLVPKARSFLGDFSSKMDARNWNQLSQVIYYDESSIQNWAVDGLSGDLRILLDVIEHPTFYKDASYLKNSVDNGMGCTNRANVKEFHINIGQELKHIIESLKFDNKDSLEKVLLHGLTKYVAFQGFCEEQERQQGIKSFYMVLKHAFNVLPSTHDYIFLKKIHRIFDEDRFGFLGFLSSNSFASLRNLFVELKTDGRDAELVRSLYELLGELSNEDLKTIANFINDLSIPNTKAKVWHSSWSKLWIGLTEQEKDDFINFLGVFLQEDIPAPDTINIVEEVMLQFPGFTPNMADALSDEGYQEQLRYVVDVLAPDKVQTDLSGFLSNKGLFEFISILTQEFEAPERIKPEIRTERIPNVYVRDVATMESVQTRRCFFELTDNYDKDPSYYNLINGLPESCKNILGKVGFVGQIYLWMNASDAYFRKEFQVYDFHSATGVWAPGMLQFIFSAAVNADMNIKSATGQTGILNNIDEIHRVVTDLGIMETFHQFSGIYKTTEDKINLDKKLLIFVNSKSDKELNDLTADGFTLLQDEEPYVDYKITPSSCKDIDSKLGANPCLSETEMEDSVLELLRILQRKNENNNSLVKELVSWVHPSAGIELPFRKPKKSKHQTTIEEIIHFLYDLSSEKTSKSFNYLTVNSTTQVKGTVLDRLEVVIRDISFLNNFYGAYFKNEVAGAKDYRMDVTDSEKLLLLLDRSSGVFRTFGGLPKESKYKLKNIRQTYSSLVEVSDEYPQFDGTTRNYGPFTQSLLAAIASSSKLSTQDFNAYRVPSERVVEGHNGLFLTRVVKMSGLRHMSQFVRARFDEEFTALQTEDFKTVNTNLIARHELSKIQNALQLVLDKYLDKDQKQLNLLVKDGIHFLYTLDDAEDKKALEQIMLKGTILLSNKNVSTANIQKLAELVELMIELWPEMSEIFGKVSDKKELLRLTNNMLDNLVNHPEEINRIVKVMIDSDLVSKDDVRALLKDAAFRIKISNFINQLTTLKDFDSDLNWIETFKAIFSSDMKWESMKTFLADALGEDEHKLTVSLLLTFLGEKNADDYRLKGIMDELFMNHRPELEQFLRETFKSLELKPD